MLIRQERPEDYDTVYEVVKKAFESAEHSDGNEQDLVVALRQTPEFIPELSMVAEVDGKIVGHILFTKLGINGHTELALAPLAVLPEYQRQGIGTALIEAGHKTAIALGYHYSVVLGSETYYPRTGYVPAKAFGIAAPFEVPDENFMVVKLCECQESVKGVVKYSDAFGI